MRSRCHGFPLLHKSVNPAKIHKALPHVLGKEQPGLAAQYSKRR